MTVSGTSTASTARRAVVLWCTCGDWGRVLDHSSPQASLCDCHDVPQRRSTQPSTGWVSAPARHQDATDL